MTFPTVRKVHYLSSILFSNAKTLSNKCKELESEEKTKSDKSLRAEHCAYFFGSIFNCVTMLEAYINEIFFDISEKDSSIGFEKIPKEKISLIKQLWELEIPKTSSYSILEKYQIALVLFSKEQFDKGANPYQEVDALIKLRNSLIHYEPEWIEVSNPTGNLKMHRLEKLLKNKFTLYPAYDEKSAFFPVKIVGAGCSEWAIKIVETFLESFESKLNTD